MIDRRLFLSLMFVATGAADLADIAHIAPANRQEFQWVGPFCVTTDREAQKCRSFMEKYPKFAAKLSDRFETKQGDTLLLAGVNISNPRNHHDTHYYPHRDLALSILEKLGVSTDLDAEESGFFRRRLAKELMRFFKTNRNLVQEDASSSIYLRLPCNRDGGIHFPIAQLPAPGQTVTAVNRFNIVRIRHQPGNECTAKMVCEQITLDDASCMDEFSATNRGEFYLNTFLEEPFRIPTQTLERMFRGERVAILGSYNGVIEAKILQSEPTAFGFKYRIAQVVDFCLGLVVPPLPSPSGFSSRQLQLVDGVCRPEIIAPWAKAGCSIDPKGNLIIPMGCSGQLVISPSRVQRCAVPGGGDIFLRPEGYCFRKGEKHLMTFSGEEFGSGIIRITQDPAA